MAKNLVVVESPAKARTVGRFLGDDYVVKASLGHVRDLPGNKMSVEIDNGFTPDYQVMEDKVKIVQELKRASKGADAIYLATDPDREGEAISWHLVEAAGWAKRPIHRVVFHEITQAAIQEAFRHPRDIDMNLVNAQQARRILDRVVGYTLSPLLWSKISGGRRMGLSAGRVQSVALRLVVDREREIEAFIAQEYWTIKAVLERHQPSRADARQTSFTATLHQLLGRKKALDLGSAKAAGEVTAAMEGASYAVAEVQTKEVRQRPAAPFTTSTLQQEASRKLRFPARKTMSIAQQLYEGLSLGPEEPVGLITYMRTDSTHVDASALRETLAYVRDRFGAEYAPKTPHIYTKKAKGAQEAHEAIRPTSTLREPESIRRHLSADQFRLYDLIWKRMVASQMTDAVSDATRVDIHAQGPHTQGHTYVFRATGSVLKFPGFRALYMEGRDETQDADAPNALPEVAQGNALRCLGLEPEQHFTQPPPRYTEATLIRTLEENGIGRPSTYAPILSINVDRNYVVKEQLRFKPTQLGKVVCDQLINHFPSIIDAGFTSAMEENLDEIASGEKKWVPVLQEFYGPFQKALATATEEMPRMKVEEASDEVCDICGKPMVIKTSRFGRFLACTGFPDCRGKKSLLKKTGVACPECNSGELVERRGKGRAFYGCATYPECKFTVSQRPLPEPCPECGGLLVAAGKERARCATCKYLGPVPERELAEAVV
ncbi:MAG: type I DNA topoisomerase [Dehalococcoidia bacterium]|nr:type I DNA topoisomerase [Dehalococcoidia bacterium]